MNLAQYRKNAPQIIFLLILAFLLMASYGFARPAIDSLFIKAHGANSLPNVWVYMSLVMIVIVGIYNPFLTKLRLLRYNIIITTTSAFLLIIMIFGTYFDFPGIYYLLYIWKDIYIILLVELFYSYTNSIFPINQAKWLYGFFGLTSALGGTFSNFSLGPFAKHFGTHNALWVVVGLLFLMTGFLIPFAKSSDAKIPEDFEKKQSSLLKAFKVVRTSKYLLFVLALIAIVQITITLIDFDFNKIIEMAYPITDTRTDIMGKVYGTLNASTFVLFALTGPILRLTGIPLVLLGVPVLLGTFLGTFILIPGFLTVAALKVASKLFDYTIFRAAKECLYIPLSYEERTQGKSIIDMIMYRLGKVGASLFVKILIFFNLANFVSWLTAFFIGIWITLTIFIVKRFRKIVSREQEMNN